MQDGLHHHIDTHREGNIVKRCFTIEEMPEPLFRDQSRVQFHPGSKTDYYA